MTRLAVAACAAVALTIAVLGASPAPVARVNVRLPADDVAFKPGAGSQTATARCLICHSAAYVTTQPPLERAKWQAEVAKMRTAFGAPMSDADAAEIVDYLTSAYGKPS